MLHSQSYCSFGWRHIVAVISFAWFRVCLLMDVCTCMLQNPFEEFKAVLERFNPAEDTSDHDADHEQHQVERHWSGVWPWECCRCLLAAGLCCIHALPSSCCCTQILNGVACVHHKQLWSSCLALWLPRLFFLKSWQPAVLPSLVALGCCTPVLSSDGCLCCGVTVCCGAG